MHRDIVVLDCRAYGQPDAVPAAWQECFATEGIARGARASIDTAIRELGRFGAVALGSVPRLQSEHIDALTAYVESGGCLIASGPLGREAGLTPSLEALLGVSAAGVTDEILVPFMVQDLDPFQRDDALLFLHDEARKPIVEPVTATTIAGSLKWDPGTSRYVDAERVTIAANAHGRGRTLYVSLALGDSSSIPPLVSGQWAAGEPAWPSDDSEGAPVKNRFGYPLVRDTRPELSIFLLGLLCYGGELPLAWMGHWPNGWKTVVSLTGDVHEKEQYGPQVGTTEAVAACLKQFGLDGLFTFSITGKAVEEAPDLLNGLIERGYDMVPHSGYTARWMFNLAAEEQKAEIEKCRAVFERLLRRGQRPLGWRGHGWSANGDTEVVLDRMGCLWMSDLHAQHYGDYGEADRYLDHGQGIAMLALPEKPDGLSVLRLPQTYYSIWWIAYALCRAHGVAGDVNAGGRCWDLACKLVAEKFHKDLRFEALHLMDWHPEEEFVRVPQFGETFRQMCEVWKTTRHTGVMQPTDVALWWLWREHAAARVIEADEDRLVVACDFPATPALLNPTVRLNCRGIARVILDDGCEWRFFGKDRVSLPPGVGGPVRLTVVKGEPCEPFLMDTTSAVKEACWRDNMLVVNLVETRREAGRLSLQLPRPADVAWNGTTVREGSRGELTLSYGKGEHVFVVSAAHSSSAAAQLETTEAFHA